MTASTTSSPTPPKRNWVVAAVFVAVVVGGSIVGVLAGKITQRAPRAGGHRIAVVDVTGASWADDAVARVLEVTPGVSVVTTEEMRARIRVLAKQKSDAGVVDAADALGLYAYVTGTLTHLDALDAKGKPVASADGADIWTAAAALAAKLGDASSKPAVRAPTANNAAYDKYIAGVIALDADKLDDAAARCREALALDPAFASASVLLGEALLLGGPGTDTAKVTEARAVLTPAKSSTSLSERERLLAAGYAGWADARADAPNAKAHIEEALDAFRKMTVDFAEDSTGHLALGRSYNRLLGAHDEALHHLEAARRITPDRLIVSREIADAWLEMGDKKHAASAIKGYLSLVPDSVEAKTLLATLERRDR